MTVVRILVRCVLGVCAACLIVFHAEAQTDLTVKGAGKLIPLAVPRPCAVLGAEQDAASLIADTLSRDLTLSGLFEVLQSDLYIDNRSNCNDPNQFAYSDWSVIGSDGLVRGVVEPFGSLIKVKLYLHDVTRQRLVLGKEYSGDRGLAKQMAHKFANEIMRFFTGSPGVFGTQIAFSSRVGRFKELFVMDMDGSNQRQLTNDKALALSPSWAPNGRDILFTSYRGRTPDLFVIDSESRRISQVTKTPGLEIGARFFPDGSIIVSRSEGRESGLIQIDLRGALLRRISSQFGVIDVSASFSPDHQNIAFCSNRAGNPQIYVMPVSGAVPAKRISFVSSNYCTSPSWSPTGDLIAFVCRADRGFNLFVTKPDGSEPLQLTSIGDNEDPEWSPDGRYIVFSSTQFQRGIFSLALMMPDGSNLRQLTQPRGGDMEPTWGPLLR